jgi:hypothetical protein
MLVVDEQKLLTGLCIREANPARIIAVGCAAHAAHSRKISVGQPEKMGELIGWQSNDAKVHVTAPFLSVIILAATADPSHPIPEQSTCKA